jgi:hypothetical protein
MTKPRNNGEEPELLSQIEEMEYKIQMLEEEERMWRDRELFMTDLIREREKEIQTLRDILHLMYEKKNR